MTKQMPGDTIEQADFRRPSHLPGLELVSTCYDRRAFPTHVHEEYVVGAMTRGAETLTIGGKDFVAAVGDLILIEPGEPHSNRAAGGDAFGYAVMYIPVALMRDSICDLSGEAGPSLPRFATPVANAPGLHRQLLRAHVELAGETEPLEQESTFLFFLSQLLERQSATPLPHRARPESRAVARARDHLHACFRERVTLRQLADVAGLSPFHLLRSFRSRMGLPPAAYQMQMRIAEAKRLLRQCASIADIAAELGFADQSHLTRHFQRIVGTSPGRYAQQ